MTVKAVNSRWNSPFRAQSLKKTKASDPTRSETSPCSAECWRFLRVCRPDSLGHPHSSCPSSGSRRPAPPATRLAPSSRCPGIRTTAPHSASTTDFLQQQIQKCRTSLSSQSASRVKDVLLLYLDPSRWDLIDCPETSVITTLRYVISQKSAELISNLEDIH